jgi:hypothetical protein
LLYPAVPNREDQADEGSATFARTQVTREPVFWLRTVQERIAFPPVQTAVAYEYLWDHKRPLQRRVRGGIGDKLRHRLPVRPALFQPDGLEQPLAGQCAD